MGLVITAGGLARASTLRDRLGVTAVLQADITLTAQEIFTDCPGLGVPLDAWARYAIDGFIGYTTTTTAQIQFCFSAPLAATGHCCFFPLRQGGAGNVRALEAFRSIKFADTSPQGAAGRNSTPGPACLPMAGLKTYRAAGAFQLRFAQITESASPTTVLAGSWLRATKLKEYAPS
jgi:hypothetical protein